MNFKNTFQIIVNKAFALYFLIFLSVNAIGQTTVTIGTGTSPTSSHPIATLSAYSATESIYLSSEINTTGNITKIAYYKTTGASTVTPDIKIYMKTTSSNVVGTSTTPYTIGTSGFAAYTLVYDGTLPNGSATGWMEVTLQTPFNYSSTSNNLSVLVVGSTAIASGRPQFQYTSMSPLRMAGLYTNSSTTAWTSASNLAPVVERANIKLTISPASGCNMPTGPTITNIQTTTADVSWTAPSNGTTPVGYQWEVRSSGAAGSGSTGLAASGNTTAPTVSASVSGLTANTPYTFYVRTDCGSSVYSASWASAAFTTACSSYSVPYAQNFDGGAATPTCSSVQDINADAKTWAVQTSSTYANSGNNSMRYVNGTVTANDWWFTPGINVVNGTTYKIRFAYRAHSASYVEGLEVKTGAAQNAAGMTGATLFSNTTIDNTAYATTTVYYTATSTGIQYFGWHAISAANKFNLYVDDVLIDAIPVCNTVSFPSSVNAVASATTICSEKNLTFNLSAAMPEASGLTYQWKSSANGTSYVNAGSAGSFPTAVLTANTNAKYFKCEVLCNSSVVLTSAPVQINLQVEVTNTIPAESCGAASLTLQAIGVPGNVLNWYSVPSGGGSIGTGPSYTTSVLPSTATYYVAATGGGSDAHIGPNNPGSIGNLGSTNNGEAMRFNTSTAVQLKTVTIYPLDAGTDNTIFLKNASGTVLQQLTFTITSAEANSTGLSVGSPKVVTLNWDIPAGTSYQLGWDNPNGAVVNRVLRNLANSVSYYNVASSGVTFTGNTGVGTDYWFYFYDWVVLAGCAEGPRVPVTATIKTPVTGVLASNNATLTGQPIQLNALPNGLANYSWSATNGYASNLQNPLIPSAVASDAGVYTVTATNADGCTATASTTVNVTPATTDFTWTGNISSDWNLAGNWDVNLVPNGTGVNVTIPATVASGRYPAISVPVSVKDMILGNNARISLTSILNVYGTWQGGASSNATIIDNGKVVLNGNAQQTITGRTQFQTLALNNNNGALLDAAGTVEIIKTLELQQGTFNTGSGTLRFRSTSQTECAIIDNFSAGFTGTLAGNIQAERYYAAPSANSFNQHFMGSPVNAPAVSQFGASGTPGYLHAHANCYADKQAAGSPFGTFFEYDESKGANCAMESWKVVTSGATENGKGYSVAKPGAGVLSLTGEANLNSTYTVGNLTNSGWSNPVTYLQTYPYTTTTVRSGWHLISNPYLASLDIASHTANDNFFDTQIQVWETTGPFAGTYRVRQAGVNAVIAPFQAFMVHKTNVGGTATYTLYGSDRATATETFYRQANQHQLKIVAENIATGKLDETVVAFNTDASAQFDPVYDANKLQGNNTRHSIYTNISGTDYAINTLNGLIQTSAVPVSMRPGTGGSFRFTVEGINTFDPTSYIYLEDKVSGQWIDLRQNPDYSFAMNASESFERFVLHFTPAAVINTAKVACDGAPGAINIAQPGTANWNYTLTNSANVTIGSGVLNETVPASISTDAGTYTLTLVDGNGYTVVKNVLVESLTPAQSVFTLSSATVEVNENVVIISNSPDAANHFWDFGNGATALGSSVTLAYQNPGVYMISLQVTNADGCQAISTQQITVAEPNTTSIANLDGRDISIWSYGNTIAINIPELSAEGATIELYNSLGQLLYSVRGIQSTLHTVSLENTNAEFVVARALNNKSITVKQVFVTKP